MYKKILCMLLCFTVLMGMAGCGSGTKKETETESPKATEAETDDDELLDMIGDDLIVVQESEIADTINQMLSKPEDYYGKIYQLTGTCQNKDGNIYIAADTSADGLRLNYVTKEFADGDKITVLGVLNNVETDSGKEIVFDTVNVKTE